MTHVFRTALLVGALSAGVSDAAARRAVVAVGNCSDGLTLEPTRMVRDALSRTALGYEFISEEETAQRLGGTAPSLTEIQGLLDAARDDVFRKGDVSTVGGEEKLRKALAMLASTPPSDRSWRLAIDVRVLLAYLLSSQKDAAKFEEAQQLVAGVLAVDPVASLDPDNWFLPAWHKNFVGTKKGADEKSVRGRLRDQPTATLNVSSTTAGLPIAVNGKPAGSTPVKMIVPAGEFVVEGLFPGRRGLPTTVKVEGHSEAAIVVDPYFDGAIHQGKGPCVATGGAREARIALLAKTARALGVDQIIGVRVEEPTPGEKYFVAGAVDGSNGKEGNEAKVPVSSSGPKPGALPQLAQFLVEGPDKVHPTLIVPITGDEPEPVAYTQSSASGSRGDSTRKIYGYSLLGVAAVGAVTTGIFAGRAIDRTNRINTLCPNEKCPDSSSTDAKTRLEEGRSGDVGFGVAAGVVTAAAAGTGAYFLMTADAPVAPTVVLTPDSATIGIVGTF